MAYLNVQCHDLREKYDGYGQSWPVIKRLLQRRGVAFVSHAETALIYGRPLDIFTSKAKRNIMVVMFESTKMPEEWGQAMKLADEIIVPSTFCQSVVQSQFGLDAKVIPLGYNDEVFCYQETTKREKVRFLHYDAFSIRKGFFQLMAAWGHAFDKENVELVLKTTLNKHFPVGAYNNVKVIKGNVPQEKLNTLLGSSDCFVFPSMGEGFGHPPLEALATGCAVIAPNSHGIAEYFDPKFMFDIRTKDIPATYDKYRGRDMGRYFQCDVENLVDQLKLVYNERKKLFSTRQRKERAEFAKQYTLRNFAEQLYDVLCH